MQCTEYHFIRILTVLKEVRTIVRTILVTHVRDKINGVTTDIYGRYDAVAINKRFEILGTSKRQYKMTDEMFAKNAEFVKEVD